VEADFLNGAVKGVMAAIVLSVIAFIFNSIRKALKLHSPSTPQKTANLSAQNLFIQRMSASDWSAFELIVKTVRDTYHTEPDRGIFLRNAFKNSLAQSPTPQGDLYPCAFGNFCNIPEVLYKKFEEAVEIRLSELNSPHR
jgi:hypothetical protein